jgi:hypothetical protein
MVEVIYWELMIGGFFHGEAATFRRVENELRPRSQRQQR